MKKEFSLLLQTISGNEMAQNWSLQHGYSENERWRSKSPVELRYAPVFLRVSRRSPFSLSLPIRNGS